jgi:hypothetical protein
MSSNSMRNSLSAVWRPFLFPGGAIGFEVSNEVVEDSLDQCFLGREMVMQRAIVNARLGSALTNSEPFQSLLPRSDGRLF